ncbi:phage major capsid protein [Acinetobacter sp. WCHAc060033]|uniref:phage major capsid protein n=1 Tax=Acinetobacter sp. WCHAc060033 TaxID=2518624 RepID=UPI0010231717|nr:phage major capsid protein [Acinetobacter sp. WCHAc060033]RZG78356.1 phage major capsid protein [Acinetobacter sp. WCHAc060033]
MKFSKINLAAALAGMVFTRDTSQTKPLPDFNKDKLVRNYIVDDFKVDMEKRTVELSFSSETEVGRWFGVEILDHSNGAIDFSRLNTRAPFLMDHNPRDQVGVVENSWLDNSQRKGRALVRLSKSARGEEILQDIDDLIRTNISVGYTIKKAILKEQREHDDVYLITEWQPYEISLVSIPADTNVGVGRSAIVNNENSEPNSENEKITKIQFPHQQRKQIMKWDYFTDKDGNQLRQRINESGERFGDIELVRAVGDTAERGAETERKRVSELMQLGERFGASDLVRQYIDEDKSPAELQNAILERMHNSQGKPITEKPKANDANIGLTGDEARSFSLMRAVRALLPNATLADREAAAFELECSEAAQQAYGRSAQGILVPADVLSRVFEVGTSQNGATLVGTDHRADMFIEMLRNRSTIMNLGFLMPGLVGDAEIPKQTGGADAYWLGEEEEVTGSSPATGQLKLSPKTVGGRVEISRKLMQQSSPSAEQLVWSDLNRAIALKIDKAAYYGTGTSNQPLGLKNISGVNAVSFAAVDPTFAEVVEMESQIASDNADVDRMSYVFNAAMRGHFKTAAKFGSGTESTIWEPGNTVNGYRTEVTNQIDTGEIFFGNFADFIIAMWGGLDITVDPYSLSSKGSLRIVGFQDVDFVLRNTESICYGKKTV